MAGQQDAHAALRMPPLPDCLAGAAAHACSDAAAPLRARGDDGQQQPAEIDGVVRGGSGPRSLVAGEQLPAR